MYKKSRFVGLINSVMAYVERISPDLREEFVEEVLHELDKSRYINVMGKEGPVQLSFRLLIIIASKSSDE